MTISRLAPVVHQYIATSPTDIVTLTVTRYHHGDGTNNIVIFRGRVINVKFRENDVEMTCQPIFSALKRPGLRRVYQVACPHVLYGKSCSASSAPFNTSGVLTDVSGTSITSPALIRTGDATFDPAYFTGGFVEFQNGAHVDRRFITSYDSATGTLGLNLPFSDLVVGDTVTAFAGCNHTVESCNGKFNNLLNYGGYPFIPNKNPMDGTSIF